MAVDTIPEVHVTGLGAVSCLGTGVDAFWAGLTSAAPARPRWPGSPTGCPTSSPTRCRTGRSCHRGPVSRTARSPGSRCTRPGRPWQTRG